MKWWLKWYRIAGIGLFIVGWLIIKQGSPSSGMWLMIGSVVLAFADLVDEVLNAEVNKWTPLWELLGEIAGVFLLAYGFSSFADYGLYLVGIPYPEVSSILIGMGIILVSGIILVGFQLIRDRWPVRNNH